ncbi:MAG: hypothetical protein ACPGRW_08050 [Flavobacteriaceae bacterium]
MTDRVKEILKINCTTVTICKNKWTGKVYKDESEMKADVDNPDTPTTMDQIQQDTTVQVSPKGLEALKKFMNVKK